MFVLFPIVELPAVELLVVVVVFVGTVELDVPFTCVV